MTLELPPIEPDVVLMKYIATFGRIPPAPALQRGVSIEEFRARMQRALDRGRPLRGWWDDGTENGDADERVPEGEEDFFVPVDDIEIRHLKQELKNMERKQMNAVQRIKTFLGDVFRVFRNSAESASAVADPPAAETAETAETAVLENFLPAADGWVTVARVGEYPHPRGLQKIAREDLEALLSDIARKKERAGDSWTGGPFYERHPANGDGPALAWAKDWRVSASGELQCLPEWSPKGRERILENKEFKRVSVAWKARRRSDGYHPVEILHVGLTNAPIMKDLPPVVNAASDAGGSGDDRDGGADSAAPFRRSA